jgi:hypothetical protein
MRAVIYTRYSTDLQALTSIEDQVRICRERIDREGCTYLHAYCDRAMSGTSKSYRQTVYPSVDTRFPASLSHGCSLSGEFHDC